VRIEQFDPAMDESRLRACYQIVVDAWPQDDPHVPPPSPGGFRGWWVHGQAGTPQQTWLASADAGTPVGCYVVELPELENRNVAFGYAVVAFGSRRHGIGMALVQHAAEQAERGGRTMLMWSARVGAPGHSFATAIGAKPGMDDARRVLDVGPALDARLPALRSEARSHASGYTLRSWTGPVPEDLTVQVCSLFAAMEDAPREDNVEAERWDPARLRAAEARGIAAGNRWYEVAAMHDASGEMAALTQVFIDPVVDGWAFQDITAVTRSHRGHRLGLHVKIAMLDWLARAEPQIRHIVTFNAVQNAHMVAVNDALGHRVTDSFQSFELPVAAARELTSPTELPGSRR
jgi:GNAT superfamily N-acetyltransferase